LNSNTQTKQEAVHLILQRLLLFNVYARQFLLNIIKDFKSVTTESHVLPEKLNEKETESYSWHAHAHRQLLNIVLGSLIRSVINAGIVLHICTFAEISPVCHISQSIIFIRNDWS